MLYILVPSINAFYQYMYQTLIYLSINLISFKLTFHPTSIQDDLMMKISSKDHDFSVMNRAGSEKTI